MRVDYELILMRQLGDNLRDIRMHSRRIGWKALVATLDSGAEENVCKLPAQPPVRLL
jgi:hypothetical protein